MAILDSEIQKIKTTESGRLFDEMKNGFHLSRNTLIWGNSSSKKENFIKNAYSKMVLEGKSSFSILPESLGKILYSELKEVRGNVFYVELHKKSEYLIKKFRKYYKFDLMNIIFTFPDDKTDFMHFSDQIAKTLSLALTEYYEYSNEKMNKSSGIIKNPPSEKNHEVSLGSKLFYFDSFERYSGLSGDKVINGFPIFIAQLGVALDFRSFWNITNSNFEYNEALENMLANTFMPSLILEDSILRINEFQENPFGSENKTLSSRYKNISAESFEAVNDNEALLQTGKSKIVNGPLESGLIVANYVNEFVRINL